MHYVALTSEALVKQTNIGNSKDRQVSTLLPISHVEYAYQACIMHLSSSSRHSVYLEMKTTPLEEYLKTKNHGKGDLLDRLGCRMEYLLSFFYGLHSS